MMLAVNQSETNFHPNKTRSSFTVVQADEGRKTLTRYDSEPSASS